MSFPGTGTPSSAATKALEAFKSGADVGAAVYGDTPLSSQPTESEHVFERDESEEAQRLTSETPDAEVKTKNPGNPDVEELVSGGKKVQIDWNDRESIKRQLQAAGGVGKLKAQSERLAAEKRELESKHSELSQVWSTLEETFKKQGAKGVINMLAGSSDAYEKQLTREMQRAEMLRTASPEQKQYLELQEALEAERAEKASILADVKSQTERAKLDREAADRASAEAAVHPVFDKYRFAGKLGDAAAEQQLDEAIWSKAIDNIQKVPEHELTQARIDKEFRTVAATFQKFIKEQGDKKAEAVVAKKKENATAAVAAASMKGMKQSTDVASVRDRIKAGDFKSSLLDVLQGKVKL